MKSVMLSIKPKYCELIANGKKTVEVRKTRPKARTPFKCYIYCTKAKNIYDLLWTEKEGVGVINRQANGKVIGEFICDEIIFLGNISTENWKFLKGNVHEEHKKIVAQACLTEEELHNYGGQYAWHISNLVIYDKAKKLEDFAMKRPPLSWCYVEELGGENQ